MSSRWSQLATRDIAVQLRTFGEPILYMPAGGLAPTIAENAILSPPEIDTSASPGAGACYFADIQVAPTPQRLRGDKVIWADGVEYVVAKVVSRPYELTRLALHRKADPISFRG